MILLIISKFFGITILGYYALANTTLNIPIAIFRDAINTVFFQRASERKNIGSPIISDLKKITIYFAIISIIPLIVLVLFAPQIYTFVLGENWLLTGKIVTIISPWLFLTLVTTPATSIIPVFGLQKYFVFLQLGVFLTRILTLFLGYLIFNEPLKVIILLSFHGIVINIFNLLYIFFKIKKIEGIEKIKCYE
jgi:O-antigen/teichoic acid export membrane protein